MKSSDHALVLGPCPSARPHSPVRRSHSERREEAESRMLEAAVRIVAERGLEELTLSECGEAAGYSRGLAAHYFGSKYGLVRAIAEHIVSDYARRMRSRRIHRGGLAGLCEGIALYLDIDRESPFRRRAFHAVLGSALKQATLVESISELNRRSAESFASLIRSAIAAGEVRADIDPATEGRLILATLRGVISQWLLDPEHVSLEALRERMIDNVLRSLRA